MLTRICQPGAISHLITRCVGRAFRIAGPAERQEYLDRAALALRKSDCIPLGFAVMSNHIHWMVVAGEQRLSDFSQRLHSPFAAWLNHRQKTFGPVFTERFKQVVFAERDALSLLAYIHNNPVRAGLVDSPADSDWTSHRYYLEPARTPPWLNAELGLALSGFDSANAFGDAVESAKDAPRHEMWSGGGHRAERARIRVAVGPTAEISGAKLGGDRVAYDIVARPNATLFVKREFTAGEVLAAIAARHNLDIRDICSRNRTRVLAHARRLALVVWRRCAQKQSEMAGVLGLSQPAASNLMASDFAAMAVSGAAQEILDALFAARATAAHSLVARG